MGIVQNQSIKNSIITFIGFGIGAINALFFYTHFLGKLHYGIVNTLLSGANILMPIMAFGAHNTLIRFFTSYKTEEKKERFLSFMLVWPLFISIPLFFLYFLFYNHIVTFGIDKNPEMRPFIGLFPVIGIFMGYSEVFFAWAKVHLQSVIGNLINEVLVRFLVMLFLLGVHFDILTKFQCIYAIAFAYFCQMVVMMWYAFKIKFPKLQFQFPENFREIVSYSLFIIVSGGVAVMLIDFDKMMIYKMMKVTNNAVYSVGIFMATLISVPSRAMIQIVAPITSRLVAEKKWTELNALYKKTSITLQVSGGLIMLLLFVNIHEIYKIIPDNYQGGIYVVFLIGISKFFDLIVGNNNNIITNTNYYRTVILLGVFTVVLMLFLNWLLIPLYGINGSALATLLTIFIYNSIKLYFVVKKLNLFPFTLKNLISVLVIVFLFLCFSFWDFKFTALLNIILKSILVSLFYVFINYKLQISEDFNRVVAMVLHKIKA